MNTPNNAAALLPCPFCGSNSIDPKGWASANSAGPACDDCGASADNIATWNRRATLAQPDAITSQPSGEAVRWEFLMVPVERPNNPIPSRAAWTPCTKSEYDGMRANPVAGDWRYEVRALYPHPSADAPRINIKCEVVDNGIIGTTTLNVVRVNPEDDGSFTAVTDHWPYPAAGVAVDEAMVGRFKMACRALMGLRGQRPTVYAEDLETMVDVLRVLESVATLPVVNEAMVGRAYSAFANAKVADPTDTRARIRFALIAALAPKPEGGHAD